MSESENLEVQRCARPNQRTERQEYGYDDGHHRSKAIRRRPETSMNPRVPAFGRDNVPTDDNARYSEESLENLVRASFVYPVQPCIVAGFHSTAPHLDAPRIAKAEEHSGFRFYSKWGAIFWAVPHLVYSRMSYPADGGRMDDRFVSFAALRQGVSTWVICMEAPFTKPTQQQGGYSAAGRTRMMAQSVLALARDYPEYMERICISFPWTRIVAKATSERAALRAS